MDPTESIENNELDITEFKRLYSFLKKNKLILILFTLLGMCIGAFLEIEKAPSPILYQAKVEIELARDKNGQYIDHHSNLSYLTKKNFNTTLHNIPSTQIYVLSAIEQSPEKAMQSIEDSFAWILQANQEHLEKIRSGAPTKKINKAAITRISPERKILILLRLLKLGLIGFLLSLLTIFSYEFISRLKS